MAFLVPDRACGRLCWAPVLVLVAVAVGQRPARADEAFPDPADERSPWLTLDAGASPFFTAIGSATSQGVSVLRADQARTVFGVTGAGVRLGVISDSFNGAGTTPTLATQIAAGNLPGAGNPNGYTTDVTVVKDDTGTDEGRAMLEIVHDVAPGAQLYFHSAFNNTNPTTSWTGVGTPAPDQSIADAIDGLAAVSGMRVIVDDVGYLTAPRFQDGPAAQSANSAFAKGIAYFSAAGNSATDATRVTTSVGVSGTVNWGSDGLLLMRAAANSSGRAVLQWGEPYTSVSGSATTSNFRVAVTTTNGASTYFTIDGQAAGQDPYEFITISNSGTTAVNVALRVTRLSGTAPVTMQLSTFGSGFTIIDADKTNAPTIYGQAAATGAVGVAASYWGTPSSVESFSSRGPTLILFDANGNPVNETRSTPLLTAPDGGTTTTSGFNPFYGTSAAAPHAAAVAALVLERFDQKGITVSTRHLYQVLSDSAVDIGTAGFDTASGHGRIDALAAVSAGRIWDGNGSTAGVAGSGTWSRANWTLEETGDKPTGRFIRGQRAIFGSGTAAQSSYSIVVDGTYDVAGLSFVRDTVTLSSGSGTLRLTDPTIDVASGLTATVAASLTGSSGLVKTGAGGLRITGSGGYTGATTISAGSLFVGHTFALGGTTGQLAVNGGTLDVQTFNVSVGALSGSAGAVITTATNAGTRTLTTNVGSGTSVFAGTLRNSGSGVMALTKTGSGTLVLTGSNAATGFTLVSGGTLRVGDGGTNGWIASDFVVATGATVVFDRADDVVVAANGGSSGTFVKDGAGTLTLSGVLFGGYDTLGPSPRVAITEGTLQVGDGGTAVGLNPYVPVTNDGTLVFNSAATTSFVAQISGSGRLVKLGTNALTLSGSNAYAGGTTIGGGTLTVGHRSALGTTTGSLVVDAGTLNTGTFSPSVGPLSGSAGAVITTATAAGTRTLTTHVGTGTSVFAGSIQNSGSGVMALTKSGAGALVLTGSNDFTGPTTISAGTLQVGTGGTVGRLASGTIANDGRLVFSRSDAYGGSLGTVFSGTGGITLAGGTLTLTAASPFAGVTTVDAGTLRVNGSLASSAIVVNAGGQLAGSGAVGGVTLNAGSTLAPGTNPGTLTAGDVIFAGGATYNWQLLGATGTPGVHWDLLSSSGSLTINATTGSPVAINLWTLAGTGSDASGPAANFNQYANYSWTIGTFAGGISGFAANLFSLVTGSANGAGGFANPFVGTFSVTSSGNALDVVYTAPTLPAYDYTGGTGVFGDGANWSLGVSPTGTPAITFSGSGGTVTNDVLAGVNGLTFTGAASGGYVVAAGGLAVGADGVVNDSPFIQTIQGPLTLAATGTVAANVGGLVLTGGIDMGGVGLAVAGAADTTITGLSGAGGLAKGGGGTLTLSGSNAFTGGVTLAAGRLVTGDPLALGGTANAVVVNGGTLDIGTASLTVGALAGAGGGVITTATNAGTRTLTTVVASGSATYAGAIRDNSAGRIALAKSGPGTLVLSGSNGFSGGLTVAAGTLQVGHAAAVSGTGIALAVTGGTLNTGTFNVAVGALSGSAGGVITTATNPGTRTLTTTVATGSAVFAGTIQNSGSGVMALTKSGAGTLLLTGSSSFTGVTTIAGGTLQVGAGGTTGRLGGGSITNHGTLVFKRSDAHGGPIANVISGSGHVTVAGGTLALAAANTFTGTTRIAAGVLSLANTQALAQSTLDLNAADAGVVALSAGTTALTYAVGGLTGSRNLALGGNTLSVGSNNRSTTYMGSISGSGGLVKMGSGTFTMTGSNSYSGATTIYGGRLVGTTINLTGTISNYAMLEFAQATSGSFRGRITNDNVGFGLVVKSGSGTLTLTGTVSGGGVSVTGGRLVLSSSNMNSSSLTNNATVEFAQGGSGTFSSYLSGSGAMLKTGNGTLTLQYGVFSGTTTVSGGRLVAPASTMRGPIVNNAAFEFAQSLNGEYASVISGSGSLTKSGTGTLTLSGSSLLTGSTSVTGGMLATGGAERLADTSSVTVFTGATLRLGGNETIAALLGSGSVNLQSFRLTVAGSGSSSYAGSIFGSGGLAKAGSGILTLTGSNAFLGATNLDAGTLVLSSTAALSPFTTLTIAAGSTLVVNRDVRVFAYTSAGTITGTGRLLTSATATTGGTLTSLADASGTDAFAVGLLKTSTATLVVSGSTSFTGGVVVEQGTVKLDAGGSFAATNVVDVRSGATLDLNGQSQTVAALAGSGSVALGGGTLTVAAATSTTFAGAIDGGALVKSGSSALNLTGSASVTTAAVTEGLMSVNGTLSGTVAVAPGGTLGGAGTIIGSVSVSGTHAPGNSPDVSTVMGDLAYATGATVVWEIGANDATQGPAGGRVFDQIVVTGDLTFSGSTALVLSFFDQDPNSSWTSSVDWTDAFWSSNRAWTIYQVSGTTTGYGNLALRTESWLDSNGVAFATARANHTFSLALSGNDVTLVYAVPEPGTIVLLASAGVCLLAVRRRRRSAHQGLCHSPQAAR